MYIKHVFNCGFLLHIVSFVERMYGKDKLRSTPINIFLLISGGGGGLLNNHQNKD